MNFYLIGVNYGKIPGELRENIYRQKADILAFWGNHPTQQASVLFTCSRIEVYAIAGNLGEYLRHAGLFKTEFPDFFRYGYFLFGEKKVLRHAIRLASGLESLLKGEQEILRQLEGWLLGKCALSGYGDFWREVISTAKEVRAASGLDKKEYNIASLVFKDLLKNISINKRTRIIIAGTGNVAELFADFRPGNVTLYFAAHKNYKKARRLAALSGGEAISFKEVPRLLAGSDALVSASSSPHRLFYKSDLAGAVLNRERPLYIYDLATPFDIDPSAAGLKEVILKNLNSADIFYEHNNGVKRNINLAERLVEEALSKYRDEAYEEGFEDGNASKPLGYEAG